MRSRIHSVHRIPGLLAAVGVTLCLTSSGAQAAILFDVNQVLPPNTTGSLSGLRVALAPNNDEAGASNPNVLGVAPFLNRPGIGDYEFILNDSGGTTEYRVAGNLANVSGVTWNNIRFELGFGTGASFVRSGAFDLLDFDVPNGDPAAASPRFTTVNAQSDVIDFSGGQPLVIGFVQFTFGLDVPDNLQNVNPYGLNRFTLRFSPNGVTADPPAVPEPTSMVLLGSGLLGLAAKVRRLRRKA